MAAEDNGAYKCLAKNALGEATAVLSISMKGGLDVHVCISLIENLV